MYAEWSCFCSCERTLQNVWFAFCRKEREAMEDAEFPDEVEAPEDRLASERFSKYRGLKSFR